MPSAQQLADADAYQRMLLDALGTDDPAGAQLAALSDIRALVADAGEELRSRPEPSEWSAMGCVAHVADAEIVMAARYRFVLAHDRPELLGYDQDLWVDKLHSNDDPDSLLRTFEALRRSNVDLWQASSEADRARVGVHRERGEESFDLMFRMLAGHDRVHLAQARRALDTVRGRPAS